LRRVPRTSWTTGISLERHLEREAELPWGGLGGRLAVVRVHEASDLECPRVSPDGTAVAFFQQDPGEMPFLSLIDRKGQIRKLVKNVAFISEIFASAVTRSA
jgi:hypothetical protein